MYLLQIHKSTDCDSDFATLNAGVTSFYSADTLVSVLLSAVASSTTPTLSLSAKLLELLTFLRFILHVRIC